MTETPSHAKSRTLCVAVICIAVPLVLALLWIVKERWAAGREYKSYHKLCAMGATGDDWVSFREYITGRPPIVQIDIPAHIPPKSTFDALPNLQNLEALTLAYPSLSTDQLQTIQRLRLQSLRFTGSFPRDPDVPELACLRGVRFLYIPSTNLSTDARSILKTLLPSCKIQFE